MMTPGPLHDIVTSDGEALPIRVWIGPGARSCIDPGLQERLGPPAQVLAVPAPPGELVGPAILLLAADDLPGPQRATLLDIRRRALPGRPVVVGGSQRRETLLDAINTWRAFQLVPHSAPLGAIIEALQGAHEALSLELAVHRCARLLHHSCLRLNGAVGELNATQTRLLHTERLAAVGRIVEALMTHAQDQLVALEAFEEAQPAARPPGALGERLECALEGTKSFSTLLKDLLALAENRTLVTHTRPEPLDPLVECSTRLFRHDPLGKNRDILTACQSSATVDIDRARIYHVLLNLLRNAAQATRPGDRIEVRTSRAVRGVLIEVEDSGTGMSDETLARIFTPFFTTKGRAGVGLGLRLAKATVESQGGTLSCTSTLGQGTRFQIWLPPTEPAEPTAVNPVKANASAEEQPRR